MKIFKNHYVILLTFGLLAIHHMASAQDGVGIGTTSPHSSAILHIQPPDNNRGLLIPRLTNAQVGSIESPEEGLLVYNMTYHNLYFRYNGNWQAVGTPRGGIIMWSGTTAPAGWALCDGGRYLPNGQPDNTGVDPTATQTPNLSGRFVVGYQSTNVDYDQPGDRSTGGTTAGETGGATTVTLTAGQSGLPSHDHTISINNHSVSDPGHFHSITDNGHSHGIRTGRNGGNGEISKEDADNRQDKSTELATTGISINLATTNISVSAHVASIGASGGTSAAAAHENRPPYYVLAYIIKL